MQRRSHDEWRALFQAQQTSGQNMTEFCQTHGVCPKYFSLRRRQLLGDAVSSKAIDVSAFVPVAVQRPAETMALEVRLGASLQLRVPPSVSPQWLAALLHALRN